MTEPTIAASVRGINHLALVCRDMAKTVDFYTKVLGMPLVKSIELPMGMGKHFFFGLGNGDCLAFFWFPNAPERAPGIASAADLPGVGDLATAHGSMNHVAFDVPAEKFDEYVAKLRDKGVQVSGVMNHDNSEWGVSKDVTDDVFIRSVYFFDPDGVLLEFACWTKALTDADVSHTPARALSRSN